MQAGTTGWNLGRMTAIAAGLPITVPGMTMDRQCSSSLIATAARARRYGIGRQAQDEFGPQSHQHTRSPPCASAAGLFEVA